MSIGIFELSDASPFKIGRCADGPAKGLYLAVISLRPQPDHGERFWDLEFSGPVPGMPNEAGDPIFVTVDSSGEARLPGWVAATNVDWLSEEESKAVAMRHFGFTLD